MKRPDKNKVYSLEDLTMEEYNQIQKICFSYPRSRLDYLVHDSNGWTVIDETDKPTTNAKELFYTLENVAICKTRLSEEQIKNIISVFGVIRYIRLDEFTKNYNWIVLGKKDISSINFNKITYDKFIELFSPEPQNQVTDVGNMVEKPTHYANGIDTFARMEANCTKEECLAFAKGNIDKYNWRNKGQDLEDLKKIIAYSEWAIQLLAK